MLKIKEGDRFFILNAKDDWDCQCWFYLIRGEELYLIMKNGYIGESQFRGNPYYILTNIENNKYSEIKKEDLPFYL